MSLRLEMLQVARLAPNLLHEAGDKVTEFFLSQFNDDGGVKDRAGNSDLYYTVFGLEGLIAMRADPPADHTRQYLQSFGCGSDLDFVHLSCLARCWAAVEGLADRDRDAVVDRIESHRSGDGGYGAEPGADRGTVYHCFLALGAYQDLGRTMPNSDGMVDCLEALRTQDGAYANDTSIEIGTAPTTAAAVTILRQLNHRIPNEVGPWLLRQCHEQGGFLAIPQAPMPDLLSTATVLHALSGLQMAYDSVAERCLDFIDSLWTGTAFCGHWADDVQDVEYTYYALLALGHLSLADRSRQSA